MTMRAIDYRGWYESFCLVRVSAGRTGNNRRGRPGLAQRELHLVTIQDVLKNPAGKAIPGLEHRHQRYRHDVLFCATQA